MGTNGRESNRYQGINHPTSEHKEYPRNSSVLMYSFPSTLKTEGNGRMASFRMALIWYPCPSLQFKGD
uniref:Uncharacterized protein n=1 Tax=Physcomitrium patens TaxID=3218 RepID=A0A2K1KSY2_PHYPA|nr:hypothetical protein PHYPA_003885 [Physcomitrium patens]